MLHLFFRAAAAPKRNPVFWGALGLFYYFLFLLFGFKKTKKVEEKVLIVVLRMMCFGLTPKGWSNGLGADTDLWVGWLVLGAVVGFLLTGVWSRGRHYPSPAPVSGGPRAVLRRPRPRARARRGPRGARCV